MRTLTRTILAAVIVLAATASAQSAPTMPRAFFFMQVIAGNLDGVVIDCPFPLQEPAFCFRQDAGINFTRTLLDHLVRGYNDLTWANAWQADGAVRGRIIFKTSSPEGAFGVFLVPAGDWATIVFIQEFE